ncbi:flippase [Epilithonimonas arachidiradicis]|uniref:Heteropolysaccharide repeat-containing protein n=1 Tax=Epilithonimonas arachidiradicis TaxID=1617282 RepID=A0A420DBR7_9FLAO|nr:flippase [Epilithonimonas arachidiradicis]RKE89006.1 O-antigen/teichoic acid export membrane protein [Epilithonimonas arachidiradicis]GGG53310.1 heteropolysaccharide repeat-containing protein [Epilithonimonas arachidiradicis]
MDAHQIKKPSIKVNFALNFLRIFSAAIVGLLTMPYITRVLGAENLGKVEYVYTIINYFVLFSALGIPMYGIREVSKKRDNEKELFKLVFELYLILFITTILSYLLIFVLINVSFLSNYRELIIIMSSMVFLSNIGAEWYFQGIENQKFITIRYITVRFLVFILIFLFVNKTEDYQKYAFLVVMLSFGANLINFIFLIYKLLKQKINVKEINILQHLKPIFTVFIATVSINIYLQLDNFLIGILSGDKYVGYYSMANKLIRYAISFITVIGAVMLPRLSFLFLNDKIQYKEYLKKSLHLMMILSVPCTIYFFVFSQNIISFMGGVDFNSSIITMQILSPLCIIVSLAYFFGFLILYPQGLEKVYTKATLVSAIFSLIINFYIIKNFQHNGAAVVAVLSELIAIVFMFVYLKNNGLVYGLFDNNLLKILAANFIVFSVFYIFLFTKINFFNNLIVSSILFPIAYALLLFFLKEKHTKDIFDKIIFNKIKK